MTSMPRSWYRRSLTTTVQRPQQRHALFILGWPLVLIGLVVLLMLAISLLAPGASFELPDTVWALYSTAIVIVIVGGAFVAVPVLLVAQIMVPVVALWRRGRMVRLSSLAYWRGKLLAVLAVLMLLSTVGGWAGLGALTRASASNISYTSRIAGQESVLVYSYEMASGIGFFQETAARLVRGKRTDSERVEALMLWAHENVRPWYGGPPRIVMDNSYSIVRRGFGYCNDSAHVFATLAHYAGYDVRLRFLLRADGFSPHTLAEVHVDGRWILVDPFYGIVWRDASGTLLTVDDVPAQPNLLEQFGYLTYGPLEPADFTRGVEFRSFPYQNLDVAVEKVRTKVMRNSIASTIVSPSSPAPSVVPPAAQATTPVVDAEALRLQMITYDHARRAHLDGRFDEAAKVYRKVLAGPLDPEIAEAVRFHLGLALLRGAHPNDAIVTFIEALIQHPQTEWRASILYYRALAKESIGDSAGAISDLELANIPPAQRHLAQLYSKHE